MASVRPIMPTWIRSSSSTLGGSLAFMWCAIRRTSGTCWRIIASRSSWPLAVYIVSVAPGELRRHAQREPAGLRQGRCLGHGARILQQLQGQPLQVLGVARGDCRGAHGPAQMLLGALLHGSKRTADPAATGR